MPTTTAVCADYTQKSSSNAYTTAISPDDRIETLRNAGIDLDGWLTGFDNVEDSVRHTVELIRKHPLMPDNIAIHGLVIHPTTGKLNLIVDGSLPVSDGPTSNADTTTK